MEASHNKLLPRILCLHGGGTSAEIFSFQSRYIQKALGDVYDFVFVDGPYESEAGPGVLPVFEGMDPFYSWIRKNEDQDASLLAQVLKEKLSEPGPPFVGVMGFSQGARVAAGLLLEQQQSKGMFGECDFHFGILLMASSPPLLASFYTSEPIQKLSNKDHEAWIEEHRGCISIPSIHVYGISDAIMGSSKLLNQCFDPKTTKVFEFDVGHWLPRETKDNEEIAKAVLTIQQSRR